MFWKNYTIIVYRNQTDERGSRERERVGGGSLLLGLLPQRLEV
jgi:hypothetical protein